MPPRGTAGPLAGSHPDRFRQGGLCAVGAGSDCCSSVAIVVAAIAGTPRDRVLLGSRDASAVSVSSRCWCRCSPASSSNGSSGAAGRSSAAKPTPSTSRISREPRPMPAFRRRMPSPPSRWPSRFRRCGRELRIAMIVYALLIAAQPAGAAGPSSERCGRGRADRRGRRDAGAVLVRGPPSGLRDPPGRHHCAAAGPSPGTVKRVARGRVRPIRSGRRDAGRQVRRPHSNDEC